MQATDDPVHPKLSVWRKVAYGSGSILYSTTTVVLGFFLQIFLLEVAIVSLAVRVQLQVYTSQGALSANILTAYLLLLSESLCGHSVHALKKAAVSCWNVRTQSFLVSVNDLPSHSGLFKTVVTACFDRRLFANMKPVVQTDDWRIEEVPFLCKGLCGHFQMFCPKWHLEVGWGLMKVEFFCTTVTDWSPYVLW